MSDLASVPLGTVAEERRRAEEWMTSAAQHLRNERFYAECLKALRRCDKCHLCLAHSAEVHEVRVDFEDVQFAEQIAEILYLNEDGTRPEEYKAFAREDRLAWTKLGGDTQDEYRLQARAVLRFLRSVLG